MGVSTRERILSTAFDLFYKHGFHATGVDCIARQSGTSRQTLYNYFDSKDDIVLKVIQRRDQRWRRGLRTQMKKRGGDDYVAQLKSVWEILSEWFTVNDFDGCLFICAASEFPNPNDPAHKAAKANDDAIRRIFANAAKKAGFASPKSFAAQFHLIVKGAIFAEVVDRDHAAAQTAANLADLLIEEHRPRRPRKRK